MSMKLIPEMQTSGMIYWVSVSGLVYNAFCMGAILLHTGMAANDG